MSASLARKLMGIIQFKVRFKTLTGLLIRAPTSAEVYRIGGADSYPIVARKTYIINGSGEVELDVPYVPGSSIKGRMRSLLELSNGLKLYSSDKKIWQHVRSISSMKFEDLIDDIEKRCVIDELFGYAAFNPIQLAELIARNSGKNRPDQSDIDNAISKYFTLLAPTRLYFSDFYPSSDYINIEKPHYIADFLEEKPENRIDRITASADPRFIARVKPGVEFEGEVTLLLFDIDRDRIEEYLNTVATGFELIEYTYLGGSGSRGYGRVKFTEIKLSVFNLRKAGGTQSGSEKSPAEGVGEIRFPSVQEFKRNIPKLAEELKKLLYQ